MKGTYKAGDSWKHRHGSSPTFKTSKQKPRALKMQAPFTFDELYRSPLREERCYELKDNGAGKPHVEEKYVARNLPEARLTGIQAMDEFVRFLADGRSDIQTFCEERGLKLSDIDSLVFILTGIRGIDFRQRYQVRMMDELLRYTSLSLAEVARRSGLGSAHNLYLTTKREYNEAPTEHRKNLREPEDEGRYR